MVSDAALMFVDPEDRVCFASPALRELLAADDDIRKDIPDFQVGSLVGMSLDRLHKDLSRESRQLREGERRRSATIKLGNRRFDVNFHHLVDDKGRGIGTSLGWSDASSRMENMQYKAISDAISRSQAVIEFEPSGIIIWANDNFLSVMGYSLDEIRGRHHRMFVDSEYADGLDYGRFWDGLRRGKFASSEFKRMGKNGKEVWIQATYNPVFDAEGRVFKVIKFATDVTRTKLDSVNSRGQIEAIHRSQAVIEFSLDGTILTANENFLELTGYPLAEIQGKHHSIFVDPKERDSAVYREFWQALSRGEYRSAQFRRIAKNGDELFIRASYNPILDLDGTPYKVVKFAHDITREYKAKSRAERERSQLIAAVATGAEELNASVREISETMAKSRTTANQAASSVDQADGISQKFNENAQATAGIVDMIVGITDQINLLALNATIESARAGDAGRGFAVVASEVKNLATQAKSATEKITTEINTMRASSTEVVSALLAVKREIEIVQQYVSSTAAAVEEQSAVANELSATVQRAVHEPA